MGDLLMGWMPRIIAVALILTLVYLLAPDGKLRAAVRFTGGLVLLAALLGPLAELDLSGTLSYDDCADQLESRTEAMHRAYVEQTAALIEERTAAYISDKGLALGVTCDPVVTAQLRDGVPFPWSVTLDCPFHPALSDLIDHELDIPRTRQSWQEG